MVWIRIFAVNDDTIGLRPVSYIGDGFRDYLDVCRDTGCRHSQVHDAMVAPFDCLGGVVGGLERLGFGCRPDEDLVELVEGWAERLDLMADRFAQALERFRPHYETEGVWPRPYQVEGILWMARRRNLLQGDHMRVGKTMMALLAAYVVDPDAPILVICPAAAKGVWAKEAARWRPDLAVEVLKGRKAFRWPEPGQIVITNYASLPPRKIEFKKPDENGRDVIVLPKDGFLLELFRDSCPDNAILVGDELHYTKGNKSLRTLRWRLLSGWIRDRGGYLWGASGTPMPNRPPELWTVLTNLGLHRETFGDFARYAPMMGGVQQFLHSRRRMVWEWTGAISPEASERLYRVMIRRTRQQINPDLPPKTRQAIPTAVTAEALRLCDKTQEMLSSHGISVEDALSVLGAGEFGFEELSSARMALAAAKIPFMLKIITDYEEANEPLVVASAYRAPIDALDGREGWGVITGDVSSDQRTRTIERFAQGELRGIGMTIGAGAVGIDLSRAHHMVFVDRDWVPVNNSQAEDRIVSVEGGHRHYDTLVIDHPLETRVYEVLIEKQVRIDQSVGRVEQKIATAGLVDHLGGWRDLAARLRAVCSCAAEEPTVSPVVVLAGSRAAATEVERWAHQAGLLFGRMLDQHDPEYTPVSRFDSTIGQELVDRLARDGGLTDNQWALLVKVLGRVGMEPPMSSVSVDCS